LVGGRQVLERVWTKGNKLLQDPGSDPRLGSGLLNFAVVAGPALPAVAQDLVGQDPPSGSSARAGARAVSRSEIPRTFPTCRCHFLP